MNDDNRRLLPPEHPTLGTSMGPTWKTFTAGIVVLSFGVYGYLMNRGGIGEWDDWIVVWGFLVMGGLFTLAGWTGMSDRKRRRALKVEFPGEPWKYDRRWDENGKREGIAFLEFGGFPLYTGSACSVVFRPGEKVKDLETVLRCVTEEWAKGKPVKGEPAVRCYELYAEELTPEETEDGYKLEFSIPEDGQPDLFCCEPVTYWEIECSGEGEYLTFRKYFPIPVYHKENPDAEEKYKL